MLKKLLLTVFILIGLNPVLATENPHNMVLNGDLIYYSPEQSLWSTKMISDDDIVLKKNLIEGTGSHSIFYNNDGTLAFALATDLELINDGKLIIVDNNLLKYYKMIFDGERYSQIPLNNEEIKQIFPNAEIFNLSWVDSDSKIWLHKPFGKKRHLILVNDTERFFHNITCKSKNVQDADIKGLITLNRYGAFRFKHFGERDGKLIFYVR